MFVELLEEVAGFCGDESVVDCDGFVVLDEEVSCCRDKLLN